MLAPVHQQLRLRPDPLKQITTVEQARKEEAKRLFTLVRALRAHCDAYDRLCELEALAEADTRQPFGDS